FSPRAAYRCIMNGSASAPSSVTTNGTLCTIKPLMKCTSRPIRSSLAAMIGHFAFRARARAVASSGRRSHVEIETGKGFDALGSIVPWVRRLEDGRHTAVAGPDRLTLATPVEMHGENLRTVAEFAV